MQNPLEAYLHQVERLLRPLPREQRTQELAELRRHLESLIKDRIEAGLSEQEAVTEAIRQFGEPKGIGKSLVRAWRRSHRSFIDNLLVAPIIMAFLRLLTWVAVWLIIWIQVNLSVLPLSQHDAMWFFVRYCILDCLGAFVVGWLVQTIAPRRALWAALFCGLFCVGYYLYLSDFLSTGMSGDLTEHLQYCAMVLLYIYIPLGLGAQFKEWRQKRRVRKSTVPSTGTEVPDL